MADRVVELALSSFIDEAGGFLREFYGADWRPAEGEDGRLVEPGHQFEWAWLLARYASLRGRPDVLKVAERLYACGMRGVDERGGVVLDALNDDGRPRGGRARLWPQTEWLKAALKLSEVGSPAYSRQRLQDAEAALGAISLYLLPFGLWRDKRLSNGGFIEEPAPASSFYHIIGAYSQLQASADRIGPAGRLRL
jgi:mannose/cellobiose epimerase-like protein (N-acyl-D-glucosamine 2-epimerase family)